MFAVRSRAGVDAIPWEAMETKDLVGTLAAPLIR